MSKFMLKLWKDDAGALIAAEYFFVATILVIGIVVGLVNVRDAVVGELTELANAYMALSQAYNFSGVTNDCANAFTDGSETVDAVNHTDFSTQESPTDTGDVQASLCL
jgi:Flp pilus assembly pilin Flp